MAEPPPDMANRVSCMRGMAEEALEQGEYFFYVRIPESLKPLDRSDKYEDPLGRILADPGLGEVVGGGQQLGEGDSIVYCGVDVIVTDREQGLAVLKQALHRLGAPVGTVIEEFLPDFQEHSLGTSVA